MNIIHKIRIDLCRCDQPACIDVVQGDSLTRSLEIKLFNNGIAYNIPPGITMQIVYCKSDRTFGVYDRLSNEEMACSAVGNVVTAKLHPQMFTVPGEVACELRMLSDAGNKLTTFRWIMNVAESVVNNMDSENYFNFNCKSVLSINGRTPDKVGNVSIIGEDIEVFPAKIPDFEGTVDDALDRIAEIVFEAGWASWISELNEYREENDVVGIPLLDTQSSRFSKMFLQGTMEEMDGNRRSFSIPTVEKVKEIITDAAHTVAVGMLDNGVYCAEGESLPYVKPGSGGQYVGKGKQIVFVPKEENPAGAALQINGGEIVEIRMRSSGRQLTEPLPAGALRIGVPYTMTFCGMYWLVDCAVAQESGLSFDGGFVDAQGYLHLTMAGVEIPAFEPVFVGTDKIYVGSGGMPDNCIVQFNPNGEILDIDAIVAEAIAEALKDIEIGDVSEAVIELKIREAIAELDLSGVSEDFVHSAISMALAELRSTVDKDINQMLQDYATKEFVFDKIDEALKDLDIPEGGGIEVSGAKVGDFLTVAEVDENGVPTAWETAEMPTGGGADQFRLIRDITIPEDITTDTSGVNFIYADDAQTSVLFGFDTDTDGNAFELTELIVVTTNAGSIATTDYVARVAFDSAIPTNISMNGIAVHGVTKNSGTGQGISQITLLGDGNAFSIKTTFGGGTNNAVQSSAKLDNMRVNKIDKVRVGTQNAGKAGFTTGSQFKFYGR